MPFEASVLRKNHTITKLKELGFNVQPTPSVHQALKEAQKYINTFLPNGKVSIKTLKKLSPSKTPSQFKYLVKELDRGKDIRYDQRDKYLKLWYKQKDFNDKLSRIVKTTGILSPAVGLGISSIAYLNKKQQAYKDLISSEILNELSPEHFEGNSKEDIIREILYYYDTGATITDNNKDIIAQKIAKVLLDNNFKFKEDSKYNKLKEIN